MKAESRLWFCFRVSCAGTILFYFLPSLIVFIDLPISIWDYNTARSVCVLVPIKSEVRSGVSTATNVYWPIKSFSSACSLLVKSGCSSSASHYLRSIRSCSFLALLSFALNLRHTVRLWFSLANYRICGVTIDLSNAFVFFCDLMNLLIFNSSVAFSKP